MKQSNISYIVKNTRFIYNLYFFLGTLLINFLKLFVHPSRKNILFISYGGKRYDDSPKAIFEHIKNDSRFNDYKLYWGVNNPEKVKIDGAKVIRTDTIKYLTTALKCGIWITNSSAERGLSLKSEETFCLNTWHGTPIKRIGEDSRKDTVQFKSRSKTSTDMILIQSPFEVDIMQRIFKLVPDKIAITGYPRNDELLKYTSDTISIIKQKLGIDAAKKVILYAPTFREYEKDGVICSFSIPFDFNIWKKELKEDYVILFRAHYEIGKIIGLRNDNNFINVSDYPFINDLMAISDILISDYSSIFFDFSILHRPMLCYAYDYDTYEEKRGVYFDIREWLTNSTNDSELLTALKTMDLNKEIQKAIRFQQKFVTEFGCATEKAVEIIAAKAIET